MGSTMSNNISKADVSKSANEQSVVYSTSDSRTSTLRASVGRGRASVSLRDYTFDREGTRVDISLRNETNRRGDVGNIDVKYGGNELEVLKDAGQFCIVYGVPHVRIGILIATKHVTETHGTALFVTHLYGTAKQRFSLVVMEVWCTDGTSFMCNLTGPSPHSSLLDLTEAMRRLYPSNGQQTTNTGIIINNTGTFNGDLNGSIINIFKVYLSS